MPRTFAPDALSFEDALVRLREGNRRFVRGEGTAVRAWHPGLTDGQAPIATVLGCSDSRAPAEYVFDQGLGDLFVIRVAGNIIAPSLVGSVEFASSQFGTRLVVVMGHTQCGAIRATMQALEAEGAAESRNQQSIVDRIKPHVAHLALSPTSLAAPDAPTLGARLAAAVHANVVASARELRQSSPILQNLVDRGHLAIVGAVYDLATGVVTFLDD
jgi:carbonic anhydrase